MTAARCPFVLPLLVMTAFTLGCSSDSPVEVAGSDGSLSFSFTGTDSGSFNASGPPHSAAWATGLRSAGWLEVTAYRARNANRGDFAFIEVDGTTGGTYSISDGDADFEFVTNTTATFAGYDRECWLETGSVTITSISAQRAQGTFSGEGVCVTPQPAVEPFTVSNGQFDIPLSN